MFIRKFNTLYADFYERMMVTNTAFRYQCYMAKVISVTPVRPGMYHVRLRVDC